MPTVGDILSALDLIAPPRLALPDDPIGLQIGRKSDPADSCLVSLDAGPSALRKARDLGAQALIVHHAVIYHPPKTLAGDSAQVQAIRTAMEYRIAVLVAHTNWDAAPGGISDTLAATLGLLDVRPFGSDVPQTAFKLVTFLPSDSRDIVLDSLEAVGCGVIGLYRRCAFYASGHGTYEPQDGANPMIGEVGARQTTDEERVEILVPGEAKQAAVRALLDSHPYDEPAFDLYPVEAQSASLPRMGHLRGPSTFDEFASSVGEALRTVVRPFGKPGTKVRVAAVVGGAGGSYWLKAKMAGCDAMVTGEARHHEAVEAAESGFCVVEAGHFATEQPGMVALADRLRAAVPGAKFEVFVPDPGEAGSPI